VAGLFEWPRQEARRPNRPAKYLDGTMAYDEWERCDRWPTDDWLSRPRGLVERDELVEPAPKQCPFGPWSPLLLVTSARKI